MTVHQMKLSRVPFEKIADGSKIIESRLFDDKRRLIDIDDHVEFTQSDDPSKKVSTRVKALYRYKTFSELFSDFPPDFFGGNSKESLLEEIERFYSHEEQNKFGVIGIKIERE